MPAPVHAFCSLSLEPGILTDLTACLLLMSSAFLSATLLPGSSEVALLALVASGQNAPVLLVAAATFGNVLGALVNWVMGRFFLQYRDRRWFPLNAAMLAMAQGWFSRYGVWSLLLSWVPVIGDPLTVIAGVLRVRARSHLHH